MRERKRVKLAEKRKEEKDAWRERRRRRIGEGVGQRTERE